jgi:Ca2+-binding RTX toxin-like protein
MFPTRMVPRWLILPLTTLSALAPVPARAATCAYEPGPKNVTVTATERFDDAVVSVGSGGAILVDGLACGTATVTNTDLVRGNLLASDQGFTVDLSGGAFVPGAQTAAEGSSPEIEFEVTAAPEALGPNLRVVGGGGADVIALGTDQGATLLNLNAQEADGIDADLTASGAGFVVFVEGRGGADTVTATGAAGTIAPLARPLLARGGAGGDVIAGGTSADGLNGGRGRDRLDGGGRADFLVGGPDADRVLGGRGADELFGRTGPDRLLGGRGNDRLRGGRGFDRCSGGPGSDDLDGCEA